MIGLSSIGVASIYQANIHRNTVRGCVQEAEGEPSLAELQEKLTLSSAEDDKARTLNGRLNSDKAAAKGLNAAVFDDF